MWVASTGPGDPPHALAIRRPSVSRAAAARCNGRPALLAKSNSALRRGGSGGDGDSGRSGAPPSRGRPAAAVAVERWQWRLRRGSPLCWWRYPAASPKPGSRRCRCHAAGVARVGRVRVGGGRPGGDHHPLRRARRRRRRRRCGHRCRPRPQPADAGRRRGHGRHGRRARHARATGRGTMGRRRCRGRARAAGGAASRGDCRGRRWRRGAGGRGGAAALAVTWGTWRYSRH